MAVALATTTTDVVGAVLLGAACLTFGVKRYREAGRALRDPEYHFRQGARLDSGFTPKQQEYLRRTPEQQRRLLRAFRIGAVISIVWVVAIIAFILSRS